MKPCSPRQGNDCQLIENGDEMFPLVFQDIESAEKEILLETFILEQDRVGCELQRLLIDAARRGVQILLIADGFGSGELADSFIEPMREAGIEFLMYDPQPRLFRIRRNWFRRLHRKLVVIDNRIAYVGGINFTAEHLVAASLPSTKQDFSARITGPVTSDCRRFILESAQRGGASLSRFTALEDNHIQTGSDEVRLVWRDNRSNRRGIEKAMVKAINEAQEEIIIVNAYFLPGYRFLHSLRKAARRGVRVALILAGKTDARYARFATRAIYDYLLKSGITIYEYHERELHAKVAVIDRDWSTIGSSNLDPTSLALNLEANVIIRGPAFNRELRHRIGKLAQEERSMAVSERWIRRRIFLRIFVGFVMFHFIRLFPKAAAILPEEDARLHYQPGEH